MVYTVPVTNEWICVSVFNATGVYAGLRRTLTFTVIAAVLFVAILVTIMISSTRKSQIAQQLTEDLSQVKSDIREKNSQLGRMREVAFRDALAGVGSKAAFNRISEQLSPLIAEGGIPVSVVMMDVNSLKYVNDNFGHEAGDSYLQGCCRMICDIYKRSPVFRLGGDEFAAVLQNNDYEEREALEAALNRAFEESFARTDRPPWERYSVSAGSADAGPGDTELEQVLKRADGNMYEAKQRFKAEHGSYR